MTRTRKILAVIGVVILALGALKLANITMQMMAPDDDARRATVFGMLKSHDHRNRSAVLQLQNAHADAETIAFVRLKTEQARLLGEELRRDLNAAYPGETARTKFRQYVQIQCEIERKAIAGMSSSQPWITASVSRSSYNKNARKDMQFGCS